MRIFLPSLRSLLATGLLGIVLTAAAQEPVVESAAPSAPVADPPSRVARLSLMEGDVSIAPAGTDEWAAAVLNRPLTSGDRIWVDGEGRAELQVGSATIHLRGGTGFSFIDLDDESLRMSVTDGAITIRVRRKLDREAIEISTPNSVVALLHPGEYHIEINDAGDQTTVKTRNGEAEVRGQDATHVVKTNEQGVFTGKDRLTAYVGPIAARTEFERWANERNQSDESSVSARYVSEDVVGYQDLDRYGTWASEPEYGYVWRPTYVAAGWAPYRHGRWVWVSPWGWSWVDAAPWGFAPFHYGRWAYVRSSWCWVPGPRYVSPVYAPALVGWYGSPHFSVSVSFGSAVGWYPLAPHEVYWPGYHHSHRYVRNVNISNTVVVNNNYFDNHYRGRDHVDHRHGRYPHAVTVVNRDTFVGGRAIGNRHLQVNDHDLGRWRGDWRPPSIAPERASVFGNELRGNRPFVRLGHPNRQVTTDRMPRSRIPFEDERRAIASNHGRPIDRSAMYDRPKERGDFRVINARRDGDKYPARNGTQTSAGNNHRPGDGRWSPGGDNHDRNRDTDGHGPGHADDGHRDGNRDGHRPGFTNDGSRNHDRGGHRPGYADDGAGNHNRDGHRPGFTNDGSGNHDRDRGGDRPGYARDNRDRDQGGHRPGYGNDGASNRTPTNQRQPSELAMRPPQSRSSRETYGDYRGGGRGSTRSTQPPASSPPIQAFRADESGSSSRSSRTFGGQQDWRSGRSPPAATASGLQNSWRDRSQADRSGYTQDRGRDRGSSGHDWGSRQYQQPQPRQYQQPQPRHSQPSGESYGRRSMSDGHSSGRSRGDSGGGRSGGGRSNRQYAQ